MAAWSLLGNRPVVAAKPAVTKAYALVHYAAWCPHCRELDPKTQAAVSEAVARGVEFVTLDFTNESTSKTSLDQAKAKGLESFVSEGGTGFIVLVDSGKTRELGRITSEMSASQVKQALLGSAQ